MPRLNPNNLKPKAGPIEVGVWRHSTRRLKVLIIKLSGDLNEQVLRALRGPEFLSDFIEKASDSDLLVIEAIEVTAIDPRVAERLLTLAIRFHQLNDEIWQTTPLVVNVDPNPVVNCPELKKQIEAKNFTVCQTIKEAIESFNGEKRRR